MGVYDELRIEEETGGSRLGLRVKPGARRDRLGVAYGGRLKIEVTAAPEKGRANEGVRALLAGALGIGRDRVEITTGASSRDKVVLLRGLGPDDVRRRLESLR